MPIVKIPILEAHEYAEYLPPMPDVDYERLKKSIQMLGYQKNNPIIIYKGKILDGRNRYRACIELNVMPTLDIFNGHQDMAIEIVKACNMSRRDLSADEKTIIEEKLNELKINKTWQGYGVNRKHGKESILEKKGRETALAVSYTENTDNTEKPKSIKETAKSAGVSKQKIDDYRYIRNNGVPKLLELAENHDVTIEVGNYIAHLSCMEQDEVVELPPSEIIQWVKKHRAKVREDKRRAEEREKENQYYEMQKKIHDSAKEAQEQQEPKHDNEPPDLNDIAANPDYISALTKLRKVQYEKNHETIVTMLTDVVDSLNIVLNFLEDINNETI